MDRNQISHAPDKPQIAPENPRITPDDAILKALSAMPVEVKLMALGYASGVCAGRRTAKGDGAR